MKSQGWLERAWQWVCGKTVPEPQYLSASWLMDHIYRDGATGEWRR
jgi:hypothetical protein